MSEQDNVFPFGKFEMSTPPDERILAVLNGLQNHMMVVLQKIDVLEHRLNELEKKHG
jgi:gamma-glutamylcysteine synthetase